jgi:hypothetical protein
MKQVDGNPNSSGRRATASNAPGAPSSRFPSKATYRPVPPTRLHTFNTTAATASQHTPNKAARVWGGGTFTHHHTQPRPASHHRRPYAPPPKAKPAGLLKLKICFTLLPPPFHPSVVFWLRQSQCHSSHSHCNPCNALSLNPAKGHKSNLFSHSAHPLAMLRPPTCDRGAFWRSCPTNGAAAALHRVPRRRPARCPLVCRAIGFDFGDRADPVAAKPVAKFNAFGLRAASLLVFNHVLKGTVGEAFLGVISAANKYQVGCMQRHACAAVCAAVA